MGEMGLYPRMDQDLTVHDYIPGQPVPSLIKDKINGKVIYNPLKPWIKPFSLVTEPASITLAGNAISQPIPLPVDNKGFYEIVDAFFTSQRADGFTVQLFDPDNRPILMNREIHVATMASGGGTSTNAGALATASSAGRPFRWPETLWFNVEKSGKALFATFRNLSSLSNTIRFGFHGLRWYYVQSPQKVAERMLAIYRQRLRTMPYFFTTDKFVQLAASPGSGEFSVRFGDEAWTDVVKLMAFSTGFDVSGTGDDFDVAIKETMTGKLFMGTVPPTTPLAVTPVPRISRNLVFGNGEFPFLMWESSLFEPNYRLTFDLLNNTQATNTIWITLGCRKYFWDPQEQELARIPG